ncbi:MULTISPECIES: low molecular weight protein tyrosine phosphatase family protein [unclassified Pedobacter]|uniref:low molecular weight protein tyrosine phosphatase family protein n=1 Tax=unclassified Pedobacter TaxID=2628915 RepID=UPI001DC09CA9|nr:MULTISPECIES: protein tyrosine phosphatase [unclassified Pedobacter]CAH0196916.1 Protein-arginine-phosphatase [Pedobacter sp. Bi36]CAH0252570.1 Protein-arginine-phosphatase [Pedobacter sp. Bi126]
MKILFVCSRNKWRSATAETIYQNHPDHQVRSAGTAPSARIKINEKLVIWADLIFVMEKKHKQRITERFPEETYDKEIITLHIPDDYQYMDEELIEELDAKVADYL